MNKEMDFFGSSGKTWLVINLMTNRLSRRLGRRHDMGRRIAIADFRSRLCWWGKCAGEAASWKILGCVI